MESADAGVRVKSYERLRFLAWEEGGVSGSSVPDQIAYLLHTYPGQAAQMRTTLIATLEREERNLEEVRKKSQTFDESYSEHYANLIWAVGWLQDPRAVRRLMGALHTGGMAQDGLADLGPLAVDALLEKVWGQDPSERPYALRMLGDVLLRESTRLDSEAVGKIRRTVAAGLEDRDPAVRAAAARVLAATEEKLYYVSRTAEERACRVQSGAEPAAGARFLGPYNPIEATQQMCRHKDGWKDSPVKCWTTYPKTTCVWPGNENPGTDSKPEGTP